MSEQHQSKCLKCDKEINFQKPMYGRTNRICQYCKTKNYYTFNKQDTRQYTQETIKKRARTNN